MADWRDHGPLSRRTLHRALIPRSLDAIKWRTGATMGPCHGGRCTARIAEIVRRELGEGVCRDLKRRRGSELVECDGEPVSKVVADQGAKLAQEARAEMDRQGLREVGSGELGIAGTRPAGIYSALQVMGLLGVTGRLPGRRAVVWGTHDLARRTTQVLADAGVSIERVLGADERVVSVAGESRLESVTVEHDGIRETIACDLLVASPRIVAE